MRVKEKLVSMLYDRGMAEQDALQVVEQFMIEIERSVPSCKPDWGEMEKIYPNEVYAAWWVILKRVAKGWIAENCPDAWYKEVFE